MAPLPKSNTNLQRNVLLESISLVVSKTDYSAITGPHKSPITDQIQTEVPAFPHFILQK